MSPDQRASTNTHENLANDLHAQYQIQIEALEAKHKKKEAILLDKIKSAETRYQELKSKYQEDVERLKSKLAGHTGESIYDENAAAVLVDGIDEASYNSVGIYKRVDMSLSLFKRRMIYLERQREIETARKEKSLQEKF